MRDHVAPLFGLSLLAATLCLAPQAEAQRFRGPVLIRSGSKCLSVNPALTRVNGAKVSLFECRGGPNQQWRYERGRLVHMASNRCLDVHGPDVNFNGARIQIWDCNNGPNQVWRYDGSRFTEQADGRCLDVHGPDMEQNGAHVQSWDCNGGPNQSFRMEPLDAPVVMPPPAPPVVMPPPPPPAPVTQERQAGPIWNNADADRKCPQVCAPMAWSGQWRTTVPGSMSVCACAPTGMVVAPVVPPPQQQVGGPMDNGRFGAMIQAIRAESFPQGKLRVLGTASSNEYFLVGQLRQVIDQMTFPADKLRALEMLAPRILDRNNLFTIYSAFTFESDKNKARAILGQ